MRFFKCGKRVLIAAVICWGCVCIVCADQAVADANESSVFSGSVFKSSRDFEPADDSLGDALRRMVIAVIIIIALGIGAMVAAKKVLPGFSQMQGKKIKVIETVHLGSRKSVHLLQVGDQQILVGSTSERLTRLADIFPEKEFPLPQPESSEVSQ